VLLKRSRSDILVWIVQECSEPKLKTHIMCKGNLNSSQANVCLERLLLSGLVVSEGGKFRATDKGHEFLSAYNQLVGLLRVPAGRPGEEGVSTGSPKCLLSRGSQVIVEVENRLHIT